MFDVCLFQDLRAEGISKELVETICERIEQRENQMHEQSATWGIFMTPNTFNR